jgi:uncharacterized protein involved in exopolysaccharide biosynthesis
VLLFVGKPEKGGAVMSSPRSSQRQGDAAYVLGKRKWFILLFFVLMILLSYLFTIKQTPLYKATAKVIIGISSPKILTSVKDVVQVGTINYFTIQDFMQTEHKIITSRKTAIKAAEKLKDQKRFI